VLQQAAHENRVENASTERGMTLPPLIEKRDGVEWGHGLTLGMMSDDDDAVQVIQHLTVQLQANPTDRQAYFLRGNAYLDHRHFQRAIEDYTRAIALAPQDPVAYNNRGIAYRSLGQAARAIADYREALALAGNYRDASNNLGLALSDLSDFAGAIRHYNRAIELDPEYWYAYNNRGMALWALGRRDEAEQDYARVKALLGGG